MTDRYSGQYFPSVRQAVLAALVGVVLGLVFSNMLEKNQAKHLLDQDAKLAHNQDIQNTGMANLLDVTKMKLWPTVTNRTNILLMGVDCNGRNTKRFENTRSDTMILASIDPFNKKVGLISIPRDSRVRIGDKHNLDKINAAHALGGPELAVKTVEAALSVPIDHYVVIDRVGLKDVFKVIGPVEVNVEKRMRYRDRASGLNIDLEPGVQELDANQVEEYLRFRYDQKGDIGRIARQQWFLRQAQKRFKDPSVLLKIPELIQLANSYVVTDMSVQDMTALAGFAKDISSESIETATLPGDAQTISGSSYWVIDPEATALVLKRLAGVSPSVERISDATQEYKEEPTLANEYDYDTNGYPQRTYSSLNKHSNDSFQKEWSESYNKERPVAVVIRYPQGQEETARYFQDSLNQAGYSVKHLIRCKVGDCQHEKIELNSFRADDVVSNGLKSKFPMLKAWAVDMNPRHRTRTDLTIQITPQTTPLLPTETVRATFDYSIKGFGTGEIKSSHKENLPQAVRLNRS